MSVKPIALMFCGLYHLLAQAIIPTPHLCVVFTAQKYNNFCRYARRNVKIDVSRRLKSLQKSDGMEIVRNSVKEYYFCRRSVCHVAYVIR